MPYSCYLLPHDVQFTFSCRMPYTLLFAAAYRTVLVAACFHMLYILLFVATRHTVCHLLLHAILLLFIAACYTVCYLLLHGVKFAFCCHMPYNLLLRQHAKEFAIHCAIPCMQFPICCCMSYSLLLVATSPYSLLFVVASRTARCLL